MQARSLSRGVVLSALGGLALLVGLTAAPARGQIIPVPVVPAVGPVPVVPGTPVVPGMPGMPGAGMDDKGLPPGDLEAKKNEVDMVVPLGEIIRLRTKSTLPIKEAFVNREKIFKLFSFQPKAAFIKGFGVGLGEVLVTIVDVKGEAETTRLRVVPNVEYLEKLLERQFPQANLKVTAGGDNLLIVEGTVDAPGSVDSIMEILRNFVGPSGRIVNNLQLAGVVQVQLEVCIARVDRTALRRMNVNFLAADQNNFIGTQVGNLIGVPGILVRGGLVEPGGARVFQPSANVNNQVLSPASTIFFGLTRNQSAVYGFIEILKQEGVAKVLANPTLVTMNGRPAEFLVGGEQPVPTVLFAGGVAQPNIQFKSFGTRLSFLPVLLGEGKIRLDVLPEVSTVNFAGGITTGGFSVPQFVTQRIHSVVEMESGQSLVLGGLLQTEIEGSTEKIPLLGDLPFFGAAFRRVSYQERETELIVIITPRLMDPLKACQRPAALPGEESRVPTDCELYLLGQIEPRRRVVPYVGPNVTAPTGSGLLTESTCLPPADYQPAEPPPAPALPVLPEPAVLPPVPEGVSSADRPAPTIRAVSAEEPAAPARPSLPSLTGAYAEPPFAPAVVREERPAERVRPVSRERAPTSRAEDSPLSR